MTSIKRTFRCDRKRTNACTDADKEKSFEYDTR